MTPSSSRDAGDPGRPSTGPAGGESGPAERDKLFSRTEYRRVIAWPERVEREAPFLESILGPPDRRAAEGGPPGGRRRVLDVGCGTGEHTRHLAERGWDAVGIDVSEKMIEDAKLLEGPTDSGGSAVYELRDAAEAGPLGPFDAAICLGNAFAFFETTGELRSVLDGVASALAPGAPFLTQMLNYERIEGIPVRNLAVNYRPLPEEEGHGEIVFLRIMTPKGDGTIDFYPITLTLKPDDEIPVVLRSARKGKHTAWKRKDLEPAFEASGFDRLRFLGGMRETSFVPMESSDLVVVATRAGAPEGTR